MRKIAALLAGITVAACVAARPASAASAACGVVEPLRPNARVIEESLSFRGLDYPFTVLLPPGYNDSARRYPVLYLLHGGPGSHHSWLVKTDLIEFTEHLPASQQAIVVTPDAGPSAVWVDWPDGVHLFESFNFDVLVPYIDRHFRTLPDRGHRGIAGYSVGALGAAAFAARHPDVYGVIGGFSGGYGTADPDSQVYATAFEVSGATTSGCGYDNAADAFGPFGGLQATDEIAYRDHSPTDLVTNLDDAYVYLASGNGIPCDQDDYNSEPVGPLAFPLEASLAPQTSTYDDVLSKAGIAHETHVRECGVHSYRYWQADLHEFWSFMARTLGAPAPSRFDLRSASPAMSVWGWTFGADPRRAREFLDAFDVGRRSLGLTGSGRTTVTSAAIFRPGRTVRLSGCIETSARADAGGRITFHVDLGRPHESDQYSPLARLREAAGDYFTSRVVSFD